MGIHLGRLGGMNLVIVLVGLGQLLAVQQQAAKAVGGAQLKLRVHLDGFKGADLDADLAAHADRNVDIEAGWIVLRFAQVVQLLVLGLLDIDAFGRALLLANLAGHAAQPRLPLRPSAVPVLRVKNQEGKIARRLDGSDPLLRILDRGQPFRGEIAAGKILCRLRQSLQYALAQQ